MPAFRKVPYRIDAREPPRCPCGHDKHHVMVSASADYTVGGWCLILVGISATPVAVSFECRRCGVRLERTTDPKQIAATRVWG